MFDGSGTSWRSVAPFLLVDSAKRKKQCQSELRIYNKRVLSNYQIFRKTNILKISRSGIVFEVIQKRFELNLNAAFDFRKIEIMTLLLRLDFDIKPVRLNLDKVSYLPIWKWNKKLSLEPVSVLSLHFEMYVSKSLIWNIKVHKCCKMKLSRQ